LFRQLLKARYVAVVIVFVALLNSVAFLGMGVEVAAKAYRHLLNDSSDAAIARPGVELLHSLDFLFVSLVLIVLALGIGKLFFLKLTESEVGTLPGWLRIESLGELKVMLWETILTTLVVVALSDLIRDVFTPLEWRALVLPAAILVLAVSLYLIRKV
jgi:uncharacterized membrane protein YqhA